MGPREGGADGRRDGRAGVPPGDPAAGDARRLHRRHPRVHLGLERLPVRQRADVHRRLAHGAGRVVVLPWRVAVHRSERGHRGGRGGRDDPDPHHGADLPAPHRLRPHVRRGQGVDMADIVLDGVYKTYSDGYTAVKDLNLSIEDGEFMILVGPSGCGKSTALNMIAGLEDITAGELRIGGEVVNKKAPRDRDIAMVFQSYALYPHMTVRDNIAFALKLAKRPQSEIDAKVSEAAEILDLQNHLDRKPANLSGGQRQRVAMGRAIVRSPKVFLMDEPLSNLDAKLRVQMRAEVARIQHRLGTTTVYVTHDQTEAMTLGDRVAVMRGGIIQQVDTPKVLYRDPANLFVAGFIGSPAMNFLPARLEDGVVKLPFGEVPIPHGVRERIGRVDAGKKLIAGIRPEDFEDFARVPAETR